jgi:nucleotide-binding universal stress UspA family protein
MGIETIQIGCMIAKMFNAKIIVVHVIEVPLTIPLTSALNKADKYSLALLKKAEAIALDAGVEMELKSIHARSPLSAIKEVAESNTIDLIILGALVNKAIGPLAQNVMRRFVNCRIWILGSSGFQMPSITKV